MYSILVDITKCTGCEKCANACTETNHMNKQKADYDRAVSKDGLSGNRMLSLVDLGDGKYSRKSCMHCLEPSCVSACLVGGISKSDDGPVVYDPEKCIGCRYCMLSCPFSVPRYEWDKAVPYMKKCDMCRSRLDVGKLPACVEACPNQALVFGRRDELLKKARLTIAGDNKYINRVWGEKEFGGTSVLFISDVDLAKIGWPEEFNEPIPELTDPLIEKTPFIGGGVALSLTGLSWIIGRRNKLAAEKRNADTENEDGGQKDAE